MTLARFMLYVLAAGVLNGGIKWLSEAGAGRAAASRAAAAARWSPVPPPGDALGGPPRAPRPGAAPWRPPLVGSAGQPEGHLDRGLDRDRRGAKRVPRGRRLGTYRVALSFRPWGVIVLLLALMVAVRLAGRHARTVVFIAATGFVATMVRPGVFASLVAVWVATWGISRLPLRALPRVLLVLVTSAVVPALRCGVLGPAVAEQFGLLRGLEAALWGLLLYRSILYQVEWATLAPRDRGLLEYLGSFTVVPLCGGPRLPPIPYEKLLGDYGAGEGEANLRRGLGLLVLGGACVALNELLLGPQLAHVLSDLSQNASRQQLSAGLAEHHRLEVLGFLALQFPAYYLKVAGKLFIAIGNLRLLGFHLGSGFRHPFLSRSFVDLWRRFNYYIRDAAMIVFYYPVMSVLRGHGSRRFVAVLAVALALLGTGVLKGILTPYTLVPDLTSLISPDFILVALLEAASFAVIAVLTVGSAYRVSRPDRAARPVHWARHGAQVAFVVTFACLNMAFFALIISGLTLEQTLRVFGYAVGV